MAAEKYGALANQYLSEADALADFDAVRKLYTDLGIIDTYDRAVITRTTDGKVKIVRREEELTRQAGAVGLFYGLAAGALAALFPAVSLGAGLLWGSAVGAGTSGLLVVAATNIEARVDAAITRAKKRAKAQ